MGILANFRDSVTIVNRTNRVLSARYDGEDILLQPGETPGFPLEAVGYAKRQNKLMGSQHPLNPAKYICLIGVKGSADNCTPIPDEVLMEADGALEMFDRSGKFWGEPMRQNVKILRKNKHDPYEAQMGADQSSTDYDGAMAERQALR